MTTYDQVWQTFLTRCKIDDLDLPTTDEAIHQTVQGAILSFNLKLEDKLSGDDETEILSRELVGNEILLLAHLIRLIILENQLIYFSGTFSPFTKEVGTRNLANQMTKLEGLVKREEDKIQSIIIKMTDDYI